MHRVKPVSDPVMLQLLKLSVRKKDAIVAACDAELRYTHLYNPHPAFDAEACLGLRDDELAQPAHVGDLQALKAEVLETKREQRRRVHVTVLDEPRLYDVTAEPVFDDAGEVIGVATAALDVTPKRDIRTLLEALSSRLERESQQLAERWHEELRHLLNVRPQGVFPTDTLLDGVPAVVHWVARDLLNGDKLGAEETDSLREVAEHWRRGGCSVEESLVHVGLLGDLMGDALKEAVDELGGDLDPSAGVEATRRLCRSMDRLKVVMVATYRDEEEDRFAQFGSTLAHQVRGHLSAALSGIQVVELVEGDAVSFDQAMRTLGRIEHALERANEVVDSVRALSQSEAGANSWGRSPLREVVEAVLDERERQPPVEIEVGELPDVVVPAEPVQLILHNLVENAIRYSNPDADRCWVKVHGTLDPDDGHLVLHVGDNGLGVPEAEQERIFLRFRRGRAARGDGFGLGLAIVRETARKIGGRILLESAPGEGSTFSLTVPAAALEPTDDAAG